MKEEEKKVQRKSTSSYQKEKKRRARNDKKRWRKKQRKRGERREEEDMTKKSRKDVESFITSPTSIVEKESLKGNCNTLNSSFHLNHDVNFSFQNSKKITLSCYYMAQSNNKNKVKKKMFLKQ